MFCKQNNPIQIVLSRNKFLSIKKEELRVSQEYMKKLNLRKIHWILRELRKGELSVYKIAKPHKVSARWVRRLPKKYAGIPLYKIRIRKCGRKPTTPSIYEMDLVKGIRKKTGFGAVNIEKILCEQGIGIPHNRVHNLLRLQGLVTAQPAKSRRRKWIRYERRHSNGLWHADWFERGKHQVILYEDDASRLITGFGEFSAANTQNSLRVFDEAVRDWGHPKQLMTDHGTQFCSDEEKQFRYTEHLKSKGVKHIMARVKHPQSNGKLERLVFTIRRLMKLKGSLHEAVKFYNEERPHMSLENGHLRTPLRAFYEKKRNN